MKNFQLSLLLIALTYCFSLPASAQQAYGQQGFVPLNQMGGVPGSVPGMVNGGAYNNSQGQFQPVPQGGFMANSMQGGQGFVPMQNFNTSQSIMDGSQGYSTSSLDTRSPYEQQEHALQEAKMLQELQELKQKKETEQGFRGGVEEGIVSKSSKKERGKLSRAMGKMGTIVRRGAEAAAPAGAAVGTLFIMRAAFGPPATFMPVATPTGTAFIPMSR